MTRLQSTSSIIIPVCNQASSDDDPLILSSGICILLWHSGHVGFECSHVVMQFSWNRCLQIGSSRTVSPTSIVLQQTEHCNMFPELWWLYRKEGDTSSFSGGSWPGEAATVFLDFLLCNILLHLLQNNAAPMPSRIRQTIIKEVHFIEVLLSTFIDLKIWSGMASRDYLRFGFVFDYG